MSTLDLLKGYLPNRYLALFLKNMEDTEMIHDDSNSVDDVLISAFKWHLSNEGFEFWYYVYNAVLNREPLPPIPPVIKWRPNTYICDVGGGIIKNHIDGGSNVEMDALMNTFSSNDKALGFLNEVHLAFCN